MNRRILMFTFCVLFFSPLPSNAQNDTNPWWNDSYAYRIPFAVIVMGIERFDKPVEVELDASLFLEESETLEEMQFALVEVDRNGRVIFELKRFSVETKNESFGNKKNPFDLLFVMQGKTAADATRRYHLYVSKQKRETSYEPPPPLVTVEENLQHEGQESFKIVSQNAVYYYHRFGAGFASIEDRDGNDWIGYNPGEGPVSKSGSGGKYRGTPNMGHPEGYCHPGENVSDSRIVCRSPLKVSIESQSNDGEMKCRWDIFPNYARLSILKMRTPYWFLYEGTPGGKLDTDSDYCVRPGGPDGIRTPVSEKWQGDINAEGEPGEWLYFGDGDRVMYFVHHRDDDAMDSYWPMNEEMTVFGFGRLNLNKYMKRVPAHFTIGFHDGSKHSDVVKAIRSAYQGLPLAIGGIERR